MKRLGWAEAKTTFDEETKRPLRANGNAERRSWVHHAAQNDGSDTALRPRRPGARANVVGRDTRFLRRCGDHAGIGVEQRQLVRRAEMAHHERPLTNPPQSFAHVQLGELADLG